MYLNLNGPDFIRVQRGANVLQPDALHPDVMFSGAYDDGTCLFFQYGVDVEFPNIGSYTINFGKTFPAAPLVFACLKTSRSVERDGVRFEANEYLAPFSRQRNVFQQGAVVRYEFSMTVTTTGIAFNVAGLAGTCSFMVMDYY